MISKDRFQQLECFPMDVSIVRLWNYALLKYWASLMLPVLLIGSSVAASHPSHVLAPDHVLFKRQAITVDDCTIDNCVVDDECITEESYNAGIFDYCFIEGLQIGFNQSTATVDEGAGAVTLTIEISQNSWVTRSLVVTYSTSEADGATNAATSNIDYTPVNGQVVFAVGEYTKNITIPIIADSEREEEEIFNVELTTDCCADVIIGQVQVNITDGAANGDDSANTRVIIITSVAAGSLLIIVGICTVALTIKKCMSRAHHQKMHMEPSYYSAVIQNNTIINACRALTYGGTSPEMATLNNSNIMELVRKESNDLSDLLLPANEVKFIEIIGEGAFGFVYKGIWSHQNSTNERISDTVAIKAIKNCNSVGSLKSILHESNIMKKFDHPNVLSIFGVCLENDQESGVPFMVLPFMVNGDLKSYLRDHRTRTEIVNQLPQSLKQHDLLDMCYQIACGMNYLATRRFVHRDLAARNCMVDENLNIKIADFGLARDIYMSDYYRQQNTGKIPVKWMAPEALNDKISNEKTDVWSYGITCWEVFSLGRTPYPTVSNHEILRHVEEGNQPDQPVLCPDKMYSLMVKCWELDANSRLNFKEIMEKISIFINCS